MDSERRKPIAVKIVGCKGGGVRGIHVYGDADAVSIEDSEDISVSGAFLHTLPSPPAPRGGIKQYFRDLSVEAIGALIAAAILSGAGAIWLVLQV